MIPARSPFSDVEFARNVSIAPFDYAAELEAQRQAECKAVFMYWRAQEREKSIRFARTLLGSLAFMVCMFAAIFAWACL